jgi:hypothetical protein
MINRTVALGRDPSGWFTSSFTNGSQTCVEVKFAGGAVLVRDTKDRRPTIAVASTGWAAFVRAVA